MTLDMRQTLALLRSLQELDRDLYSVNDELRRLPEEMARRRAKIDDVKSQRGEVQRRLREVRARVKEIEDMTTSQRQRIRKLENEVGGTADTALIVAYQHEIRSLKRDVSSAEEEGLELVEEVERISQEEDELTKAIEVQEEEFAEYAANVEAEVKAAEERRDSLDAERKKRMTEPVAPEVLVEYEKLLTAREGEPMAALDGRICQGCYVSVPNNVYVRLARGMELVNCPSCKRILFLPEAR